MIQILTLRQQDIRKACRALVTARRLLDTAIDAAGPRRRAAILAAMVKCREGFSLARSVEIALFHVIRDADSCGRSTVTAAGLPRSNGKDTF